MKKSTLLLVAGVFAALLLITAQVFAAPGPSLPALKPTPKPQSGETDEPGKPEKAVKLNQGQKEVYHGVILSVDAASLTVQMADGTTATVALTTLTRLHIPTLGLAATAADLLPGMRVMVKARLDEAGILTALSVNVIPGDGSGDADGDDDADDSDNEDGNAWDDADSLEPLEPGEVYGLVTAYTPGVSITLQLPDGTPATYLLTPNVKINPRHRINLLDVGAVVTLVTHPDAAGTGVLVKGIIVHPKAPTGTGD